MDKMKQEFFMKKALQQAQAALKAGEFPVGCVIADMEKVVAEGVRKGTRGEASNEVDHAEMVALRNLWEKKQPVEAGRLTIYCTMEPCLMCFGAILLSGIRHIVYAYEDVMGGGTGCNLQGLTPLYQNAAVTVVPNVLRAESLALFKEFFSDPTRHYWEGSFLARYTLEQ